MRKLLVLTILLLQACSVISPLNIGPNSILEPTQTSGFTVTPSPTETAAPTATEMPPTPEPSSTPTTVPTVQAEEGFQVRLHPDGGLFVGDRISFEVIAPPGEDMEGKQAQIQLESSEGLKFEPVDFDPFGIAGRIQATFVWVWDTAGFDPGKYEVTVSILPEGETWAETVTLIPQSELPEDEQGAKWESIQTECCVLNYVTNSDAARDIEDLADTADEQAELVTERLGVDFTEPVTVTLIPRSIGHGGFAGEEIYITYSDENYVGSRFDLVLHHEMVHIIDGRLEGESRPSVFVEGLAVYLTGGHFKSEELLPRAAALLELSTDGEDWYVPLRDLANDFYPQQHEIGYLQGAALVEYMVNRWSWDQFNSFYRSIPDFENSDRVAEIDSALQDHYGISFDEFEAGFMEELRAQEMTPEIRSDLEYTVSFYDTVRRYQMLLDPSAYFTTAWLMDGPSMRERGIVADFVRSPTA
ncbi:MAG: hypothetical protein EHM41_16230, partial [Chloroflexi bacterium]